MPFSRTDIVKPSKWKGTPEMREVAEGECWEEFMDFMEGLEGGGTEEFTTEDLVVFHASWYMRVGHANLGRMYVALARAIAVKSPA